MPTWTHKLKIADIWNNDEMAFEEHRDAIVERIKAARFYDPDDYDLDEIVDELAETDDYRYFNQVWQTFYDWCDEHRVWVETFTFA